MKRVLGSAQILILLLLTLSLLCTPLAHAKESKASTSRQDPYVTAENYDKAPTVNTEELAYRVILFEDFTVPSEWESDARKLVNATEDQAIGRLISTTAFATVAKKQSLVPDEPYMVVKCTLVDYRIVRVVARFFGGPMAGRSYLTYRVQVYDGKSGERLFEREITTENSAFAAAFSFNDRNLSSFLGNVLGDYLALRARKDKGVDVLPLEPLTQTGAGKH
jgi:hypothetical protein